MATHIIVNALGGLTGLGIVAWALLSDAKRWNYMLIRRKILAQRTSGD